MTECSTDTKHISRAEMLVKELDRIIEDGINLGFDVSKVDKLYRSFEISRHNIHEFSIKYPNKLMTIIQLLEVANRIQKSKNVEQDTLLWHIAMNDYESLISNWHKINQITKALDVELSEKLYYIIHNIIDSSITIGNIETESFANGLVNKIRIKGALEKKEMARKDRLDDIRERVQSLLKKKPDISAEDAFNVLKSADNDRFNRKTRRQAIRDIRALIAESGTRPSAANPRGI